MFKKIVWLGFSTKGKKAKDLEKYIASLVKGWANEFFTGYNPEYWSSKFGFEVSPNGRFAEHEQITDIDTLKNIVKEVHKYDLEIFINLNAWYYTDQTFPLIEQMVQEFEEIWVDGIICWNISILEYLKEKQYKWKINISTIMAVYNSEAIKFLLENYKINKIILSREITLKEIEELVTEFSATQFEVFWEWDFCRYNNWLCFAEHKYGAKDICTVVVNDLVIKKKFRADFKDFLLDPELTNIEKVEKMNDEFSDIFDEIEKILQIEELNLPFSKGVPKGGGIQKYEWITRFYSSDYSDILWMDNLSNFCTEFIPFFEKYENIKMEIRTKSANISSLVNLWFVPKNTEIAFSLNPQILIDKYEKWTSNLDSRIEAINELRKLGFKVWVRFLPLLPVQNYEEIYSEFIAYLKLKIDFCNIESSFASGLLYTKKDYNKILSKYPDLDVLHMLDLANDGFYRESKKVRNTFYKMFKDLDNNCMLCLEN